MVMHRNIAAGGHSEEAPQPDIDLVPGVTEIFADWGVAKIFGDMARVVLARQSEEFGRFEQVGLLLMPARAFHRCHAELTRRLLAGEIDRSN